ncbi:MAG: response regulator [Tistlia sp.]|uniref:response regulator n=1 Tax=Tistlia sp. TaxID=3057121 RepID=UPI0034A1026D
MSSGLHVLIVEDKPLTALMLTEMLADLGYASADVAATEQQAIALARRHRPDLITTDVRIRGGSGPAAVASLIRDGPLPVVYVTGNPEELDEGLRPVTVVKPVCEALLARAIERALLRAAAGTLPDLPVPDPAGEDEGASPSRGS